MMVQYVETQSQYKKTWPESGQPKIPLDCQSIQKNVRFLQSLGLAGMSLKMTPREFWRAFNRRWQKSGWSTETSKTTFNNDQLRSGKEKDLCIETLLNYKIFKKLINSLQISPNFSKDH